MGENYLSNNEIDPRIFLHEKSHLDEKHTWDLLFIEIVKAFTWFNPALYFYKRAMITNHEFLADEAVINHNFSIRDYQNLIIKEITDNQGLAFTHPFNFNNTKKRFIMMNTKKSKLIGIKKIASIPILITAFGLFVQKTYAYNPTSNPESITTQTKTSNETPLTESLVKTDGQKDITNHQKNISDTIRPTTKSAAKKTTRNKDVLVPPSPIQGSKSENTNTNQNADTPPPPAPSASFVQADFPQGINEFRNRLAKNFNGSIFKGNEGLVRTNVFISINSDGTVQKITANGDNSTFNEEAERTVKTVTQNVKWTPATNNGQPVATVFKIPLTMSFDNGKK
ncbi:hypothetical protein IQ37_02715 [Chryseobacterium piperi]|uniref:Peptidase M56 domain-containing protein n=2 Tax=Chryseobacterium piperi TaxID=558152 RepID=A0A086BMC7_9FLAO|nr:hypothetical protein IQ37_02715 [Chryseobacterium piperi]